MKTIQNVKIEKIVFKGLGLGHAENKTIFVQQAIPGDIVDVQVINEKKETVLSSPIKYTKKSEHKIDSPCEAFGKCGGCDWVDVEYSHQLELKRDILIDLFGDTVDEDKILPVIASPQKTDYRNKAFQPVQDVKGKIRIGMFEKKSHRVIQHRNCSLQPDIFDNIFREVKKYLVDSNAKVYDEKTHKGNVRHIGVRYSENLNEIIVIIVTKNRKLPFTQQLQKTLLSKYPNIVGIVQSINSDQKNKILGDDEKIIYGRRYLNDKLADVKYQVGYDSFYQINSSTTELLYDAIKDNIEDEKIIDAYCGAGTISLFIANKANRVVGIDSNTSSIENANKNAKLNAINNCRFILGKVEDEISKLSLDNFDTIIFDPPRKGIDNSILDKVVESKINKIIYISCNPSTQKRDLLFLRKKGYNIDKIQPFDMFPQTWHIENLVILSR